MSEIIHSNGDILQYLEQYKVIRAAILMSNQGLTIPIKPPNLSEEISESIACKLINDGVVLSEKYGKNCKAERFGKSGVDILINDVFKIECKGTTSLDGFISVSKTNLVERDAWIWLDFQLYIHKDSPIVSVHIIHHPEGCIKPRKIEANGESKMRMSAAVKDAIEAGTYESHQMDANTLSLKREKKIQSPLGVEDSST
jgi:hypothetical protein